MIVSGRLRVVRFVHDRITTGKETLDPSDMTKLFFTSTQRYINESVNEIKQEVGQVLKTLVLKQMSSEVAEFNVTENLLLWAKKESQTLYRVMAAKIAVLASEIGEEQEKVEALCDSLLSLLQQGVFEDDETRDKDVGLAEVMIKANVLDMLKNLLQRNEEKPPAKKVTLFLKSRVSELCNLLLHPNVQLREKAVAVVGLVIDGRCSKELKKAWNAEEVLDKVKANLAELLRHSDASAVSKLLSALLTVTKTAGVESVAKFAKKMLGVFYEEKKTDTNCFLRRAVVAGWMTNLTGFVARQELELFLRTAVRNESTDALAEEWEAVRKAARDIVGLEEYAELVNKFSGLKTRISGGSKRKLVLENASGKKIRVDG